MIETVFAVYRERGHRQYGEDVTELQHALQCAMFAAKNNEPAAIVAACLLHDYGHLLHDFGEDVAEHGTDARHEELGADRLAQFFPPEVAEPVRLHVAAKRYLCLRQPDYFNGLSEASQLSLQLQGGAMTAEEANAFEQNPHSDAAVRLRRYDDAGKIKDLATPELEAYRSLLESFVGV
ncbi:MAG: phosphonate degradation HD-domain oxygenase [Blastocatellia bacterium]